LSKINLSELQNQIVLIALKMIKTGKIYLFPCPISEGKTESLSTEAINFLHQTKYFIVERAKTARHFLKTIHHPLPIAELNIHEITNLKSENETFLKAVFEGADIGVISDAGCPGIADPGAEVVDWAHTHGVRVVPFVGPSSILMALMSSGMSGQNFAFNGYLSNKKPELIQELKSLETKMYKSNQTQIFMETPYRNDFVIETCLQSLRPETKFCIACDINGPDENIRQMKVSDWKKAEKAHYHKKPCIFIIGK
jgi:16S rRNA (cytidine1402-2'-O)-methyltransferase